MSPRFSRKKRNVFIFVGIIVSKLVILQFLFFIYSHYFSDDTELLVFQTDLENKLYQNVGKKTDYVSVGDHVPQKSHSLLLPVSEYYCGLPVPKGIEGLTPSLLGTVVLLKGSASSIFSIAGKTEEETLTKSDDYHAYYSSVVCAQKSMPKIGDARLSRYFLLLGKTLGRNLEAAQKNRPSTDEMCSTYSRDVSTYALLRAYAVGSRLASVYRVEYPASPNKELLVTTINSATSQLEGLAVLSAVLTTWAGADEKQFELYVSTLSNVTRNGKLKEQDSSLNNPWLTMIDNARFCVPKGDKKSCWCPRLSLTNSIAQRFRTAVMATLRNEVTRVQSGFNQISPNVFPALLQDSRYLKHPDWPHMALSFMTNSLCNQTWPMFIQFTKMDTNNANVFQICSNASKGSGCIPEDLISRLWRIRTHVDEKLGTSKAYLQYLKLASFPFLQLVMEKISHSRNSLNKTVFQPGNTDLDRWMHIFVGQFDSIKLLLRSLEVGQSDDLLYTAGRFVVELHRGHVSSVLDAKVNPNSGVEAIFVRFLLDGEEITNRLPFCKNLTSVDKLQLCPAAAFISFLQGSGDSKFWNLKLDAKLSNMSPFENYCRSTSVADLLSSTI